MINFKGTWTKTYRQQFKVPPGYFVAKIDPSYVKKLIPKFQNLADKQKEELQELEIKITKARNKRNLDQNALMWALYDIESTEMNGGMQGHKDQMVTPDNLYSDDIKEYAPKITAELESIYYGTFAMDKRIIDVEKLSAIKLRVKYYLTTSHFNTKQMAQWIERILNRMAWNGVPITDAKKDILKYWQMHKQKLNDEGLILNNDELLTKTEYKRKNPSCEGCGGFVGHGGGSLAHIEAVGMGGDRKKEPTKSYSSKWFHLCDTDHALFDNGQGVPEFIKKFPWTRYKITKALNRDYDKSKIEYPDVKETYPELDIF